MPTSKQCHPLKLKAACNNCPFRKKGAIELLPGRLNSIIKSLVDDDKSTFDCHKTVHGPNSNGTWVDGEYHPGGNELSCYGAMSYLAKIKMPNVAMRMGHAIGLIDINSMAADDSIIDPMDPHSNNIKNTTDQ